MKDQEIIKILKEENEEFRKLVEEHQNLEKLLAKIDTKRYLTPDEEYERKRIQKQKLYKKDKMAGLIREYKKSHLNN